MAARGFDKIALRVPDQWDAEWYRRHFRDVLSKGDARNVIPAGGLSVTGNTDEPATLTGSPDVATLMGLPFVLTSNSASVANERKLTGSSTVTVTDGGAGGNVTLSIPDDGVTYAKMQNISATSRFLGRISSGAGNTEELTPANATSLLNTFTSSLQGLVPASGGGTTTFLRADGSFAAPSAPAGAALTKSDDTNVTLTLGGTPTTALLQAASLTLGWTGTLAVSRGGSGAGSLTGYLKGNGTSAFTASSTIPYSDLTGTPTIPTLDSGTYTPTISNASNLTASTAYTCQYMRVGNVVTVSGKMEIQTSASTGAAYITLPIASNFTAAEQAGGQAFAASFTSGMIYADPGGSHKAIVAFYTQITSLVATPFSFTYLIV